ncbi:MAG: hypothetical protein ACREIC_29680 [Limisphaerales bacterium]
MKFPTLFTKGLWAKELAARASIGSSFQVIAGFYHLCWFCMQTPLDAN